jgi:hypothetical protein
MTPGVGAVAFQDSLRVSPMFTLSPPLGESTEAAGGEAGGGRSRAKSRAGTPPMFLKPPPAYTVEPFTVTAYTPE